MRLLYTAILFLFFQTGFAQDAANKIFIKEIKWTIEIPENFELVQDSTQDNLNKKGAKLMGEANDIEIPVNELRNLFSVHNGNNMLYSTTVPFSEKKDGSYLKANEMMKQMLYKTFADNMPKAQLDSSTSKVIIDSLLFEKFTIVISLNKRHLFTMCVLYKLYKNLDFAITYLYMSDWAKSAIEKSIFQSKFDR